MKRHLVTVALAALLAVASTAPAWASGAPGGTQPALVTTTFRLHVEGSQSPGTTFWVAYGPLADRWGVIQMHPAGVGLYVARAALPAGRTVFSYLQGQGVAHTRLGRVPGDPTITIKQLGPMAVSAGTIPTVQWRVPVG